ncbi:NB-ARC domain-containing protein [Streptomyces sp. NPDC049954]|uniref:ATP-binding protein n=1 Tax=Streptomyces sp. NPDC049954 TaxID=3155779 RepID=UPI00343EAD7D
MVGELPEESSTFVGREGELKLLVEALSSSTRRLVALTGGGGIGKSRLALAAARAVEDRFPDGVRWADLSPVTGDRLLVSAVSKAVGLADQTPRHPVEALCAFLATRRLLLVLDSGEQAWAAGRDLVGDLLTACPGLTVLVASRRCFGLAEEKVLELGPLPADGPDALALFTERAVTCRGRLAHADLAEAGRICRRLEGIPLALELAAAQTAHATLREISAGLGSRLDTGAAAPDGRPERHRTMATAIGWSHELCRPADRLLWARLTVFGGSFDLPSARAVCTGGPLTETGVSEGLERLTAQSVLHRRGGRYWMLGAVRDYGRRWLTALGEHQEVAGRHARHFLRLLRLADAEWLGPRQITWFTWSREAYTDLCAALEHLLGERPDEALDLAGRTVFFWTCCGRLHEARAYLELALSQPSTPGPHRTRAMWALGVALALHGEYASARELSERCGFAAAEDGDAEGVLGAAYAGGLTALLAGRPQEALLIVDTALSAAPGPDLASGSRLRCLLVRVFAYTALDRLAEAGAEAQRLRKDCLAIGERWTLSYLDYQLTLIRLSQDRPVEALRYARASLESKRAIEDAFGSALGLDLLTAALSAAGRHEAAARMAGVADSYWRTTGHPQRGTPELAPLRERFEQLARQSLGAPRYEGAFRAGLAADHREALGAWLDGEH